VIYHTLLWMKVIPSVLWRCWLVGRKGIWPVKNWVVGCWRVYLSGARYRLACGPADATASHCLLLPAYPGSPGKRAVNVCVCVCVCVCQCVCCDISYIIVNVVHRYFWKCELAKNHKTVVYSFLCLFFSISRLTYSGYFEEDRSIPFLWHFKQGRSCGL